MAKKIEITQKQAIQFNQMLYSLRLISKKYQTPDQLRRSSEKNIGLEFGEALEYAYENIQGEAKFGSNKVRPIKIV